MPSRKLSKAQRFHHAIREALLKDWDPIGVKEFPEARDEYDSYVGRVYKLLISRKPKSELFEYLWWLETVHMGLLGDRQATEKFAERLIELQLQLDAEPN